MDCKGVRDSCHKKVGRGSGWARIVALVAIELERSEWMGYTLDVELTGLANVYLGVPHLPTLWLPIDSICISGCRLFPQNLKSHSAMRPQQAGRLEELVNAFLLPPLIVLSWFLSSLVCQSPDSLCLGLANSEM